MRALLTFESLAVAFFAAVALATPWVRAPRRRRVPAALLAAALAAGIAAAAPALPQALRLWLGHLYLVAGYWLPALLVPAEARSRFEAWLRRTDRRWRALVRPTPSWAVSVFEAAYLLCYPLVPAAFLLVWRLGDRMAAEAFWTAVLAAGFACYGLLPWLVSSPPRREDRSPAGGIRRLNLRILARVSHGLNTFPSGHVAVSIAAALHVLSVSDLAGVAMLATAAAIAGGAVLGRYHYAMDVAVGLAVGIAAAALV